MEVTLASGGGGTGSADSPRGRRIALSREEFAFHVIVE